MSYPLRYLPCKVKQFLFPLSEVTRVTSLSITLATTGRKSNHRHNPSPIRSTGLTGRFHHAGPKLGLLVERVVIGAAELVDVHARRSAHTAVVADEHVKVLQTGERRVRGNQVFHFPYLISSVQFSDKSSHTSTTTQKPSGLITGHDSSAFPVRIPVSQEMRVVFF